MKKINVIFALLCGSLVQAAPFVTTFVNTSNININVELHFSDNSMASKGIAMSQSYQVVNFDNKTIGSVVLSSPDKDQNGNYYGQLNQNFTAPTADVTYNIALQAVPAHTVPAGEGTDAFEMPATQTIICNVAPATSTTTTNGTTTSSTSSSTATASTGTSSTSGTTTPAVTTTQASSGSSTAVATTATAKPVVDSLPAPIAAPTFKK